MNKKYCAALGWACVYLGIKKKPEIFFKKEVSTILGRYNSETNVIVIQQGRPEKETLNTLFHELVHCKQFEQGWLKIKGETYFWKKSRPQGNGYTIEEYADYYNSPHERQARDVAKNMTNKYQDVLK